MIVECDAVSGPRLVEAYDLKRFKVRLVGDPEGQADMRGIVVDGDDALVPIELVPLLPGAPGDAAWISGFRAMVEAAAAHGWIDSGRGAIKAHVERA